MQWQWLTKKKKGKKMKKIIILGLFLLPLFITAQTVVRYDDVINKYGATGDTLNLNDKLSDTCYVKDFSVDAEIFWDIDSVSGTPKVTLGFYGSYDNSTWITINESDLTIAEGDTTFVQSSGTYLYPYLKAYAKAITNAQTVRYKYNLVIRKNN